MSIRKKKTLLKLLLMIALCATCILQMPLTSYAAVGIGVKTEKTDYITAKNWPKAPEIGAQGAVLIDATTGQVLYAKNADTAFYPASITKIMTSLLALENCKTTDELTFSGDALRTLPPGYVTIAAVAGEKMPVEDWLSALLIYSANDAANALATHVGGNISNFADMMNERAKKAGAKNTHFNNPSGLHETDHYTTPYDMAMIMKDCIKYDDFVRIAGTRRYTISKNNKRKQDFTFSTRHQMLPTYSRNYYEYAICGKTGYTTPAGNTLVTYAEKDGMKLICCVMKCAGGGVCYTSTRDLFEYGFKNFSNYNVSEQDTKYTLSQAGIFNTLNSSLSALSVNFDSDAHIILPNGVEASDLDTKLSYLDGDSDTFAEVTYSYEGMKLGTVKLNLKLESSKNTFDFTTHEASTQDSQQSSSSNHTIFVNIWLLVAAVVVVVGIIIVLILKKRKKEVK